MIFDYNGYCLIVKCVFVIGVVIEVKYCVDIVCFFFCRFVDYVIDIFWFVEGFEVVYNFFDFFVVDERFMVMGDFCIVCYVKYIIYV